MASVHRLQYEMLLVRRYSKLLSMSAASRKVWSTALVTRTASSLVRPEQQQRRLLSSARPLHEEQYEQNSNNHQKDNRRIIISKKPSHVEFGRRTTKIPPLSTDDSFTDDHSSAKPMLDERTSPTMMTYTGQTSMPLTSKLHIVTPQEDTPRGIWPVFRLMDEDGHFRDPALDDSQEPRLTPKGFQRKTTTTPTQPDEYDLPALRSFLCQEAYPYAADELERNGLLFPALHAYADVNSNNTLLRAHRQMIRLQEMDSLMMNVQRQGRISFYMPCRGEEAIHMGTGSALHLQDPILAQYREQGLIMWRGFTLEQFANQCFSNDGDLGKGRQMPVHYGSRALSYHTVSSPLGTQLPQATGVAYRLKLAKKPNVAIAFLGDGAASTTDFHAALNFAATLKAPVLFFVRNNGYAISTSTNEQYAGDGIVSHAPGYGMAGVRVDGNDVFAVHATVREARKYALENNAPVLIEAMTYRQSHHSTSDDSSRYRSPKEVERVATSFDPILRLERFLKHHDWLSDEEAALIRDQEKFAVLAAMNKAEKRPKPSLDELFTDVYHDMPPHLKEQKAELLAHLAKYPNAYR